MLRLVGWWVSFVLCGLGLTTHFTLVQLSNMPLNPISFQLDGLINTYVNPLFSQRWNFFAPQPIDRDMSLLARGRCAATRPDAAGGTPWLNVSDPLIAAVKQNRLSSLQLIQLMLSNAVVSYNNALPDDPRATYKAHGVTYLRPVIPATVDPPDLQVMARTAMAALEAEYPACRLSAVQLGLLVHRFPRFTERAAADSTKSDTLTLIQWLPAAPVAPWH